jgi:hypothetical protein
MEQVVPALIWLACFVGFGTGGVVCTFFPRFVQRAAMTPPKPKWKFIPKAEEMWPVRWMGGAKYFQSRGYLIQLRLIGIVSLAVALGMLIATLRHAYRLLR